jgi:lauroyl/myristoyl acyltransferase/mitochondrial fission protein ELM1
MNSDSIIDYTSFILFRAVGFFIRCLPCELTLLLGKRLGDLLYYFDVKHKAIAYSNIKTALGDKLPPSKLSQVTRKFYQAFGQTLMEVFIFPLVDKRYLDKYITFEGLDNITSGFKKGKGVILAVLHEGSWEMSNIISANLGYPFNILIRDQPRFQRLNRLLNSYRSQKGTKLIQTQSQTKNLIAALKKNEAVAMTVDQGASDGVLVKFFGRDASMSTGAVRLSLKYGAAIIPVFSTRLKGPYLKFIIEPPFEIKESGDVEKDVQENLQRLIAIYERQIAIYPQEYLWTYKIWKYTTEKNILILSDGKTGHLRQAQGAAKIVSNYLKGKDIKVNTETIEVKFKNRFSRIALTLSSCFSGKYYCQGCLWCLKKFLQEDIYNSLVKIKPDIIISCGSSLAPVNFVVARENLAKSIVIMRPSILSTKRFDLVIISRHDRPLKRKNLALTAGALNLVDDDYLNSMGALLKPRVQLSKRFILGLLLGGDAKDFKLSVDAAKKAVIQIKETLEKLDGQVLITTSRRTPAEVERLVKEEFLNYPRCKLLVIANEKNIPEAVGGILALSEVVVVSPESVSMISEAINSKKYVLVFKEAGLNPKHERFLAHFAQNKYIYLVDPADLDERISDIWRNKPQVHTPEDNLLVTEAIGKVL